LANAAALAATPIVATQRVHAQAADGKTKVVFWHVMNGALGEEVNRLYTAFNASKSEVEVQPVFKGSYPDLLTAAIAAARAGQAPHLAQIFEVGTGTMLAAGLAVKHGLAAEPGNRRQDRPRLLRACGAWLLRPARWPHGRHPLQLLHHSDVVQ
jgi:sn-glycerol 3-phosphate transport system substrate-binding protein